MFLKEKVKTCKYHDQNKSKPKTLYLCVNNIHVEVIFLT